jgi:hypothetical protein
MTAPLTFLASGWRGTRTQTRTHALKRRVSPVKGDAVDLALDATDDTDGFTKVYLSMPRRLLQRHEHLLSPPIPAGHIILQKPAA